ncbi:unnamed protein product [Spirodela intermedia]|uniref:Homeobox domain-containing protein n=1 Tax=Spirodela intermedia TaxID=51605 RepID=A0A7I8IZB7_SPIIN|nr:unnamed protein product [Spirodela intermedia]CAA6663149.1 unnamed protein product [Spirodela intermedia]
MAQGVFHFRVMTDEQMEVLRKQISVYATICQQLVEMHKAIYGKPFVHPRTCPRNPHCDSSATPGGHKMASRQRWSPTPAQLLVLESIFDQGNVAPSKQKVKEIASELANHGQISETNVYNWFQNRRARLKRKQPAAMPSNQMGSSEAAGSYDPFNVDR